MIFGFFFFHFSFFIFFPPVIWCGLTVVEKIMILCIAFFSYDGLLGGSVFGDGVSVRLKCRVRLRRKLAVDTPDKGSGPSSTIIMLVPR